MYKTKIMLSLLMGLCGLSATSATAAPLDPVLRAVFETNWLQSIEIVSDPTDFPAPPGPDIRTPPPDLSGPTGTQFLVSLVDSLAPTNAASLKLLSQSRQQEKSLAELARMIDASTGTVTNLELQVSNLTATWLTTVQALMVAEGTNMSKQALALTYLTGGVTTGTAMQVRGVWLSGKIYDPSRVAMIMGYSGYAPFLSDVFKIYSGLYTESEKVATIYAMSLFNSSAAVSIAVHNLSDSIARGDTDYQLNQAAIERISAQTSFNRTKTISELLCLMRDAVTKRRLSVVGKTRLEVQQDHDLHVQELRVEQILGQSLQVLQDIGALKDSDVSHQVIDVYQTGGGPLLMAAFLYNNFLQMVADGSMVVTSADLLLLQQLAAAAGGL